MNTTLNPFIENPETEFHLRELARILKKSPATISKQLKQLTKQKIITMKKLSNHNYFRANTENKQFKQLKFSYNLQTIQSSSRYSKKNSITQKQSYYSAPGKKQKTTKTAT